MDARGSDALSSLRRLRAANALTVAGRFELIFCAHAIQMSDVEGMRKQNVQTTDLLECKPIRRRRRLARIVFEPHLAIGGLPLQMLRSSSSRNQKDNSHKLLDKRG